MELQQNQIDQWKRKHGNIFMLTADDGKECVIFDPCSDFKVIKAATIAMRSNGGDTSDYAGVILNAAWLTGDEAIKREERYWLGLADEIYEFTVLPECSIKKIDDDTFEMTSEGETVRVRQAKRADIQEADRKNPGDTAYATKEFLLGQIAKDEEDRKNIDRIRSKGGRSYLGLIGGIEQVYDKVRVGVKKL